MKLSELPVIYRPDLSEHPEMKACRPHPIGIADAAVYQYEGTNVYQWYTQGRSAYWSAYGVPHVLDATAEEKAE